jgi:hypothetical protein
MSDYRFSDYKENFDGYPFHKLTEARQPYQGCDRKGKVKVGSSKESARNKPGDMRQGGRKVSPPVKFENEMAKIKIYVPFNELIKKGEYRDHIIKMLNIGGTPDTLNVHGDHPAILFGPRVEEMGDTEGVPPFYVSLKVHDITLHNAMLDSGASHNIMPKVIMDELGLDITRPYKDIFSFDSRKVKCLGLIKDLVVSMAQIISKNWFMDVVMADIPPKFGMLLSRSWVTKLKGNMQMDILYATIPIFRPG